MMEQKTTFQHNKRQRKRVFWRPQMKTAVVSLAALLAFACSVEAFHAKLMAAKRQIPSLDFASARPRAHATLTMKQLEEQIATKSATSRSRPSVNKMSLSYYFPQVPYVMGIKHIHSPEHISETHKLGAPFFKLMKVLPPKFTESKASIKYFCSSLLVKNMYIRMFTNRPDQSNLIFFTPQGKALFQVSFMVLPTDGFSSHKLTIDLALFTGWIPGYFFAAAMSTFLFINGLEDRLAFARIHEKHDYIPSVSALSNLAEYRRIVTSKFDPKFFEFATDMYQNHASL